MTYDQARELVDTITHIAKLEIEAESLDPDNWDRRDDIATKLHELRDRAANILANEASEAEVIAELDREAE